MEEDYKRLYLEQKMRATQMELQALQLRFNQMQAELPAIQNELMEYGKKVESEKIRNVTSKDIKKAKLEDMNVAPQKNRKKDIEEGTE